MHKIPRERAKYIFTKTEFQCFSLLVPESCIWVALLSSRTTEVGSRHTGICWSSLTACVGGFHRKQNSELILGPAIHTVIKIQGHELLSFSFIPKTFKSACMHEKSELEKDALYQEHMLNIPPPHIIYPGTNG